MNETTAQNEKELWYFTRGGHDHGPFTSDELMDAANNGHIFPTDEVWNDEMDYKVKASEVEGLFKSTAARDELHQRILQAEHKIMRELRKSGLDKAFSSSRAAPHRVPFVDTLISLPGRIPASQRRINVKRFLSLPGVQPCCLIP
jgi:hypothetical protein